MSGAFRLGLTGSIGMGKSTTARMFRDAGVPVWDADAAVHRLYAPGGAAVGPMAGLRPEAVGEGGVDRAALRDWIAAEPDALARIEALVHPLVAEDRAAFLEAHAAAALVVLDIPLLYETGAEAWLDAVAVVSAPAAAQRARVLARPGMDEAAFAAMLAKQVPDAEKRARADHVIETRTLEDAQQQVQAIVTGIRERRDA